MPERPSSNVVLHSSERVAPHREVVVEESRRNATAGAHARDTERESKRRDGGARAREGSLAPDGLRLSKTF